MFAASPRHAAAQLLIISIKHRPPLILSALDVR